MSDTDFGKRIRRVMMAPAYRNFVYAWLFWVAAIVYIVLFYMEGRNDVAGGALAVMIAWVLSNMNLIHGFVQYVQVTKDSMTNPYKD